MPASAPPRSPSDASNAGPGGFARSAEGRLRAVQAALTDLLATAGLGGARPTEVSRSLGLDKTLAWKIARFVEDPDARSAAKHMPGSGGVEIVVQAAADRGVGERWLAAVRNADSELREFVRQHAGDRRSFEAMLAAGERDERLEFEERRSFFRAGAAIWGVRARVQMLTLVLRPSETEDGMLDVLQLSGLIGFERLRPDVPWTIRRLRIYDDAGRPLKPVAREPIEPEAVVEGVPLFTPLCTEPAPEVRRFEGANGWLYNEIAPGPVGRRGEVSCVTGEVYRAALPFRRGPDNESARYALTVRTPVETVLFDLLLHEDLAHFSDPELRLFASIEDRPAVVSSGGAPGPMYDPRAAHQLGSPPVLQTPRIAGYSDRVAEAVSAASFGGLGSYRGFRAEVDYPAPPCELKLICSIGDEAVD